LTSEIRPKQQKPKRCKVCAREFLPTRTTQIVCSIQCAIIRNRTRERRPPKDRPKTLGYHLAITQRIYNQWIRLRDADAGNPCIYCGSAAATQWQACHYQPVGAFPEKRFCDDNVHRGCSNCNKFAGDTITYRANLVKRIGAARVRRLEKPAGRKQYRLHDLEAIQREYKNRIKTLQKLNNGGG